MTLMGERKRPWFYIRTMREREREREEDIKKNNAIFLTRVTDCGENEIKSEEETLCQYFPLIIASLSSSLSPPPA